VVVVVVVILVVVGIVTAVLLLLLLFLHISLAIQAKQVPGIAFDSVCLSVCLHRN